MTDHGVKQPYNGDYGDHAGHLEGQDDTDRYLKGNPFGDEKEGESSTVKYVTMSWWFVLPTLPFVSYSQTELTRRAGTVVLVRFPNSFASAPSMTNTCNSHDCRNDCAWHPVLAVCSGPPWAGAVSIPLARPTYSTESCCD